MRLTTLIMSLALAGAASAQTGGTTPPTGPGPAGDAAARAQAEAQARAQADERRRMMQAELEGISVRVGDIGGFRGARTNKLMGYGLVVGLDGTGDSRSTPFTATLMANALTRWGTTVDQAAFRAKNIATVSITAELPPFAAPGRKLDITVQSIGDAKSLQGGFLLPSSLTSLGDPETVYVVASGAVSIGGFNAGGGGNSVRQNHANVGRIPDGGDIERSVPTQIVFEGGTMFFDLDQPDFTTAERVAQAIAESYPDYGAAATDGVTIAIRLPAGVTPTFAAQQIEGLDVMANLPASVVINERTGTIVIGGNVRLGPAVIAHGSLRVRIETDIVISQPGPFSGGTTVVAEIPVVTAAEQPTQYAVVGPNATIADLAKILQTLNVTARDIIAILQALADQGALKARIRIQ